MADDRQFEWSSDSANGSASAERHDDPHLVAALRDYLLSLERGTPPSREAFLDEHAEIAWELGRCLDGLELVHEAAVDLRGERDLIPRVCNETVQSTSDSAPMSLGDFRIIREIGRGGMGIVYEAQQLSLGRRVAVKVLPFAASLDPARLERFRNEAQAAARLHHTNVVPVYAVGLERGVHFYAMQLIEGHSLAVSIRRLRETASRLTTESAGQQRASGDAAATSNSPPVADGETILSGSTVLSDGHKNLPSYFRTIARLVCEAALALDYAHGAGIVHRDIKPANLLLDDHGQLWVTDFGLAQFHTDSQLTATGDLVGTLRYMSPEQAAGRSVLLDQRTDIYSLGATMFELLTLEPIFDGQDRQSLLRQILDDEPRSPRAIDRRIPRELETIVLKATAKSPGDRYTTAADLADDLDRWLDDRPISARRPTIREHAARWKRRHRALVRAGILFLCLSTLGLAGTGAVVLREHAKTNSAYQRELKQRRAADASVRQARHAIDELTELVEEEFASKPFMRQSRRKFLETSLAYYRTFLQQRGNDPTVQADLVASSKRVAKLLDELAVLDDVAFLMLLSEPTVQDDLRIPTESRPYLNEIVTRMYASRRQMQTAAGRLDAAAGQEALAASRANKDQLLALLSPAQTQRLKQIYWQHEGPFAFKIPEVAAALQLTHAQRQQINMIIEDERPRIPPPSPSAAIDAGRANLLGDPHLDRRPLRGNPEVRAKMALTVGHILQTLTTSQVAAWRRLIGLAFAFPAAAETAEPTNSSSTKSESSNSVDALAKD